ncbi:FAS1 domain-containing protein fsc1 [Psilocybe cubensis]|uniref:FAS1 domain-containing protein fsc1 n=1 Tax=Psilocybe cubensis TaxID=181762 RepID=A0ACB8HFP4_PSICU|nr:FAS1 domain-containing protein fsc1 [Psilocybe cubensis]KAH9486598.1 FAS1 domain-containing protein fsc1 [Psilocybe cubensis]
MLLAACLPLALLASIQSTIALPSQEPWKFIAPFSMTLVDALGADPDYSSLLRLLQRARLIPTLNRLNGTTLFAPTNDAIKRHSLTNPLWSDVLQNGEHFVPDNIQEQLRQQLLYHLLNETLAALPTDEKVTQYKTLLYPRKPVDPPSREPPPHPPWLPIPGGTLGGEPQRLRLASHQDSANIGVDAFGKNGAKIVKGVQDAGNGILLGIAEVLEPPPDLATVISQHPSISYFQKIATSEILRRLNATSEMTLFLPLDNAWDAFHPVERMYLESEFASEDLNRILDMHAVVNDHVIWSDSFESSRTLTTIKGTTLDIVNTPEGVKIQDAMLIEPDIYASNGVLHLVSALLFPPEILKLTPEKYLLALNCKKFVSLLHSVDLVGLINDTDSKYTILAPSDDIISIFDDPEFPEPGSEELKRLLQYHFIPGKWTTNKLKNGSLLETALEEPGLNGGRQVMSIEVHSDDKKKSGEKVIRFGGAGIIGDPAIFSTSKAEILRKAPTTSLLIPRNEAFTRLGLLVSAHLLAPSSKEDLESVIMHHALNSVQYSRQLVNGSQHSFATLEGSDVKIDRESDGTPVISSSGGWTGLRAQIYPQDLLTQTGVVHELSDIMIPRSVKLTIGKLVKAAKGSTMATLVNKAGFEWILNGTAPPEGSPWSDDQYIDVGWTLLCPTDDAFKQYNLTQLYSDIEGLKKIVTQHLIPTPSIKNDLLDSDSRLFINHNQPLDFDDATYSTLHSAASAYGDIVFQKRTDTNDYVVGIKGARGTDGKADSAHVQAWGRSTTGTGTGGVIQIDRLLIPYQPSWWYEYWAPSVVGGLGVVAICTFFYGVRLVWRRDTTEATYEPVGGFGRDDDS